jgi:glycerol-3-phosphate dehydrogenase (NAD(P)+)
MGREKVAVLTAGSWGTALARVLADNGHEVTLWARSREHAEAINRMRRNERYLPCADLPASIAVTCDLAAALDGAGAAVFAAPSAAMREVARAAAPHLRSGALVIHAAKGFTLDDLKRMSTVLSEELGRPEERIVALSGPSHAEEVARRLPTTVVVASRDRDCAERAQDLLMNREYFRVYTNPDLIGVETAGAIKNIIAIGAGLSDGLGYGDNARAALVTRGLAEIGRLGAAMGANPLTFAGLAGVGDLVVTCSSRHSRNWRAGFMLAEGLPLEEVLARMGMVVEGVNTTKAAYRLAGQYGVSMPITEQLHDVLFAGKSPLEAVQALMGRVRTHEIEEIPLTQRDKQSPAQAGG